MISIQIINLLKTKTNIKEEELINADVRAQEKRILCDTRNTILILPFTLQHLCNTRVTVENIHEITSDVVIMIIAVLLCLSPRDSGRVYNNMITSVVH